MKVAFRFIRLATCEVPTWIILNCLTVKYINLRKSVKIYKTPLSESKPYQRGRSLQKLIYRNFWRTPSSFSKSNKLRQSRTLKMTEIKMPATLMPTSTRSKIHSISYCFMVLSLSLVVSF